MPRRCPARERPWQRVFFSNNGGGAIDDRTAIGFRPQIFAPASLCAAICSFVCRVSTSWRDGMIGCTQSQLLVKRGSVAHPVVETAIKSSIAVVLYVRSDHRRLQPGILACRLAFFLPCCLANSTVPQPLDTQRGANHCWRLPVTASMDF